MNPPLDILAPGPWDTFAPYGGLHAVAFAICALLIAAPSLTAARCRSVPSATCAARLSPSPSATGWLTICWWNWHGLDLRTGLPLQICDVNGLIGAAGAADAVALGASHIVFLDRGADVQAFVQPALRVGPASPIFWAF